jgi:hypothetical protein
MTHQQVIENFVQEGQRGTGTYVKATKDVLYSRIPALLYRSAERVPLAVRLKDDGLLVNGAGFRWPITGHQRSILRTAETSKSSFASLLSTRSLPLGPMAKLTIGAKRLFRHGTSKKR